MGTGCGFAGWPRSGAGWTSYVSVSEPVASTPRSASSWAVARPIPVAAPVTMAVFPANT